MRRIEARAVVAPAAALGGLIALALAARAAPTLALVNQSPSLPEGLYLRAASDAPGRGAVVAVRQPALARAYLAKLGMPADVRLLKRVAAVAGDDVCASPGAVQVGGRRLPVRERDRLGTALPIWRGCRRLAKGELFLVGDTPASFDSRYFGPVAAAQVEGVFRKVVRW